MNSIYHVFMLCNIAIPSNNFVKISECFVILHYKLIIAQANTKIVQGTTYLEEHSIITY